METQSARNRSCWKRRTHLEKWILVILPILITVILVLVIVTAIQAGHTKENIAYTSSNEEICITPSCISSSTLVFEYIDTNVNPCDNFYKFACGNYIKTNVIPDDQTSINSFSKVNDKVQQQLRVILEAESDDDPKVLQIVKNYYRACMNKDKIAQLGLQVLKNVLVRCGGWPVLEGPSWDEENFEWENLMFTFNRIGFDSGYFVGMGIGTDLKNNSIRYIQLDQASLGLSRDFILQGRDSKFVKGYFQYMIDVAVELGSQKVTAERELRESLDFEIELAKISLSKEDRRNITMLYNVMTIAEIQQNFPSIKWLEYFNSILYPEVQVNSNEAIIVVSPRYLSSLTDLIKRTPKRVQANYAIWRAVKSQISYLTESMIEHQLNYFRAMFAVSERQTRWKECVDEVSSELPILTSALYIRKYFDNDAKSAAREMVNYIKKSFHDILASLDWMDEETRKSALEKAARLESHIGYPDELLDNELLEEYYKTLKIHTDEYLASHLNIQLHYFSTGNSRLRKAVNKTDWVDHSNVAQVNAFYNPLENSIMVPAGILQGTYFHKDRPRYMNFAAIGSVIGHEITHGFDDTGKQFDKDGIFTDWWDHKTEELFMEKTQCIIDQYGKYIVLEVNQTLNGFNTQGENIADNGGIKEAYFAYKTWVKKNGPEAMLPGLNYSPSQLFWISGAINWCALYRPEVLTWLIAADTHSVNEFRVLGPFSNSLEFASDFNCPSGSQMNPIHKCTVW